MKIVKKILSSLIIIILLIIVLISGIVFINSKKNPNEIPSIFGYKPFVVLSGSMETEIYKGDLVIVKKVEAKDLKENDIIAFRDDDNYVVTHRIVEKIEENGEIKDTAETITVKIIEVCTVLILYLISRIVLKFIAVLGDLIAKLPILKQFNKLGGTIFGALKGLLIVYVILAVVYLISPLLKENATKSIDETILTKAMYNNNIITKIIL